MLSGYHGVTGEGEGVISAILARSYKHFSDARAAGPQIYKELVIKDV